MSSLDQGPGARLAANCPSTARRSPKTMPWVGCLLLHSFPNPQTPGVPRPAQEVMASTRERSPGGNNGQGL